MMSSETFLGAKSHSSNFYTSFLKDIKKKHKARIGL